MQQPATRKQYGKLNYSEGGAADRWADYELALRGGASSFNTGAVYSDYEPVPGNLPSTNVPMETTTQEGFMGIPVGALHNGIMRTRNMFYGILGAAFTPQKSGITAGQTYLAQWAADPLVYRGDAPLGLQPTLYANAPWLQNNGGTV